MTRQYMRTRAANVREVERGDQEETTPCSYGGCQGTDICTRKRRVHMVRGRETFQYHQG